MGSNKMLRGRLVYDIHQAQVMVVWCQLSYLCLELVFVLLRL